MGGADLGGPAQAVPRAKSDGPTGTAPGNRLDYAVLFDASPVPCVVLAPPSFTIVTVNAAVLRATGARRQDLLGRPLFEVFPYSPATRDGKSGSLFAPLRRVLKTKEPAALPVIRYDVPAQEAPHAFMERWWAPVVSPILGQDSEVELLIVQVDDVTDTLGSASKRESASGQEAVIARLRQSNVALARETEARRRTEEHLRRAAKADGYRVRLSEALESCTEPETALATALEAVVEFLDADVAFVASAEPTNGTLSVTETFSRAGDLDFRGEYPLGRYPSLATRLSGGETIVIADASKDSDTEEPALTAMLSHGLWSSVTVPLHRSGSWTGMLNVACAEPRRWLPEEIVLIEETAQRAWSAAEALRAERRLRQNAETFENLIASAPFGVYVTDADMRLVLASRTAHATFGHLPGLIGSDLGESLRKIWNPQFATWAAERFRETLESGEPFTSKDTVERRADRNVQEAYDWRLERIVLPDGRFGVVCYYYDLTERKRLEDLLRSREEELRRLNASLERKVEERTLELQESEARFSRAFADAPVAACVVTLEGERVLEVNQAFERLTGYEASEAVGRTAAELGLWTSPEDVARIAKALEASDGYKDLELKVTRKDGSPLDVLGSASLINWGGEKVRMKMFIDNTANKRTQELVSKAIKDVMADAAWFSRNIVERLSRAGDPNRQTEPSPELTPREQQVLARIAIGMTDKAIAEELGVSHQTVRNHVARIYAKIKVHSRSQAVVWAREKGIPGSAIAPL